MELKGPDVNNFFKDAMAVKKNPYQWIAQGGDLKDLYHLIYRDKLVQSEIDKAIEAARAKWDEEHQRQTKVPTPNPAQRTPAAKVNEDGLSMSQLLEEAAKKTR